jgi:hypothetical protein
MDFKTASDFFSGKPIYYNSDTKEFKTNTKESRDWHRLFVTELSDPLSLKLSTIASAQFLDQLENAFEKNKEVTLWLNLSTKVAAELGACEDARCQEVVNKIVHIQTLYKSTHTNLTKETPEFLLQDPEFLKKAFDSDPDCLSSMPESSQMLIIDFLRDRYDSIDIEDLSAQAQMHLIDLILRDFEDNVYLFNNLKPEAHTAFAKELEKINLIKTLGATRRSTKIYQKIVELNPKLIEKIQKEVLENPDLFDKLPAFLHPLIIPTIKEIIKIDPDEFLGRLNSEIQLLLKDEIRAVFFKINNRLSLDVQKECLDLIRERVKEDIYYLNKIDESLRAEFIPEILKYLQISPGFVFDMGTKIIKTLKEEVFTILSDHPNLCLRLNEELKRDKAFLLELVSKNGLLLEKIANFPGVDKSIKIAAITQNPKAICYADCVKDDELCNLACRKDIDCVKHLVFSKQKIIVDQLSEEFLTGEASSTLKYFHNIFLQACSIIKPESLQHPLKIALIKVEQEKNPLSNTGYLFETVPEITTLTEITPVILEILLKAQGFSEDDCKSIISYIKSKKQFFKNGASRLQLIKFFTSYHFQNFAVEEKKFILQKLLSENTSAASSSASLVKPEVFMNRMQLLLTLIEIVPSASLLTLPDFSETRLISLAAHKLIDQGLLDPALKDAFSSKFLKSRHPTGIFVYSSHMKSEPLAKEYLKKFILDVCTDQFYKERNANNSQSDALSASQKTEWEKGHEEELPDNANLIVKDSDDYMDLFLCGTEVANSCQSIYGEPHLNCHLVGYLLDGKCRMICIKDKDSNKLVARSIIKIFKKVDGSPALFLESTYPHDSIHKDALIALAKKRAQKMGCDLFIGHGEEGQKQILSCDKPNFAKRLEYEDAHTIEGIPSSGIYKINAYKVSD